jgi:proline iminopeptidase
MRIVISTLTFLIGMTACQPRKTATNPSRTIPTYTSVQSGGIQLIPVRQGKYKIWTKQVGNGHIKVLLLHGGPGLTHEYMECMESYLPQSGITFYYYDQLGSHYSDHPTDTALWSVAQFTDEVEEVRQGLGLDSFYLLGHSWGGMLAMEYAYKYPKHLRGAIISNMTASIPDYVTYINKLRDKLPASEVAEMKHYEASNQSEHPRYKALVQQLYNLYICRMPVWPEPLNRSFAHINNQVYNTMQGNNEFVVTGRFRDWTAWDKIPHIQCPTLVIGSLYDEMNPAEIDRMGKLIPHARVLQCKGSHMSMWDDQQRYMTGLIQFLWDVDSGSFEM